MTVFRHYRTEAAVQHNLSVDSLPADRCRLLVGSGTDPATGSRRTREIQKKHEKHKGDDMEMKW